jgi:O-antigen/teichoic acid export membrane protein
MLMLSTMKGPEIWGWYGAAHKLIDFTNVIPTVLMIATFPTFARISLSFDRQLSVLYTRGFKILFLLAIPMIPGIIFLAGPIISVYYGKEFIPAAAALELLGITAAFLFINIFTAGLYGATNNQKKLVLIQVMGLCLNAFLNYMFIPKMEHVGAALATVITEGIVLLITLMYAFSRITKLDDKKFILHALFASALMSGVLVLVHSMPLLLMVVIGITVYFAILFFLKTITLQDFINIKKDKLNNR